MTEPIDFDFDNAQGKEIQRVREKIAKIVYQLLMKGEKVFEFETLLDFQKQCFYIVAAQILALPEILIKADDQSLPSFASVEVPGKPEVKRFYEGYRAGQQDMKKANFARVVK